MAQFPWIADVPPSASGRSRHDPLLGLAKVVVSGVWGLTSSVRARRWWRNATTHMCFAWWTDRWWPTTRTWWCWP